MSTHELTRREVLAGAGALFTWDEANWTVRQEAIRPYLKERYRAPWKLNVLAA